MQKELTAIDYKKLMINDLKDLHHHWLKALENMEANKIRIAKQYNKKVKAEDFEKENWFGRLSYHLELKIINLANGLLIRKGLIRSSVLHLGILTFWRCWKEKNLRGHLMENFLRSIILASGLVIDS